VCVRLRIRRVELRRFGSLTELSLLAVTENDRRSPSSKRSPTTCDGKRESNALCTTRPWRG
jgi:hypothetical protein